jgi:hypothetical protein
MALLMCHCLLEIPHCHEAGCLKAFSVSAEWSRHTSMPMKVKAGKVPTGRRSAPLASSSKRTCR